MVNLLWSYFAWLMGISAVFVVLEWLFPRRAQPMWRAGIGWDLLYLVLNGHFVGVLLARWAEPVVGRLDGVLEGWGVKGWVYLGVAGGWPKWVQFVVALVVIDFVQWCIHNTLHRVPWLWRFHQVHHSIETMDWIGVMRFHWVEPVVYKSLGYIPLVFFGFSQDVLFWYAVYGTAQGHLNHANLNWSLGPLRYVLNSPNMHVWHHVHGAHGPINKNFGINLSVWDWIFGTAHMPARAPERLGFEGIEGFPKTLPGQAVHPVPLERGLRRWWRRVDAGGGEGAS